MTEPRSMLAATYTQGGSFAVRELAAPEIEADEMRVRIKAASICGTDVKIVRSGHRKLRDGQRIVLGHEFVGVIDRVGVRVEGYCAGQRVGVVPNAGCGRCEACLRGKANYCPTYTAFGIDRDGGHAGWVRIPSRFITQGNVMALPAEISDREASLLEPFSCVVNGVRAARLALGDAVVVYGAGPIGLMHVLLCRAAGAGKLISIDVLGDRLERARHLGSDVVVNPREEDVVARVRQATGGQGVDVVITACPAAEVQTQAVQLLAPFGRLCLFGGLPKTCGPVPLDTNAIHYGNFLVTGSTGGSAEDYRIAQRLVSNKRVNLSQVISNEFPLSGLQAAYDTALAGAEGKVVLVAD